MSGMIPADLLAQYKAQRNATIGIDFDTQEIEALYGVAREEMAAEMIRLEMAAALHAKIKMAQVRVKQIMLVAEAAEDKADLLHEANNILTTVELAAAMIKELKNYGT